MTIIEMSIQASVMIAVIVIIRALGFGKLPKWSFQALWGAALLRLLVPFRIESPFSAYSAVQTMRTAISPAPVATGALTGAPIEASAPIATATQLAPTFAPNLSLPTLWAVGALLLMGWFVLAHLSARAKYASGTHHSAMRLSKARFSRTVSIRTCAHIDAPLTYGILRPVVLIPQEWGATEAEMRCALAHELAHVRHWDALKKWLMMIAVCAHWFNPLAWALYVLASRDMELSCDERVLRECGNGAKVRYATMLVDMEAQRSALTPLASHFNRTAIEERIIAIMKYKKTTTLSAAIALLLILTTAALAMSAKSPSAALPTANHTIVTESSVEDPQDTANRYAPYAPFGLTWDAASQRLYYQGELVRYFSDMTTLDGGMSTGTLAQLGLDGSVDVRAIRKWTQGADNSLTSELIGLERYSDAEFAARTTELTDSRHQGDDIILSTGSASVNEDVDVVEDIGAPLDMSEWWTADEYTKWLAGQREKLPEMIGSRTWSERDGWITWDQSTVDETLAMYEQILANIKAGHLYGKANGLASETGMNQVPGVTDVASESIGYAYDGPILVESGATISMNSASATAGNPEVDAVPAEDYIIAQSSQGVVVEAATGAVEEVPSGRQLVTFIILPNGDKVGLGVFSTYADQYDGVKAYCDKLVREGKLTQTQANEITEQYR